MATYALPKGPAEAGIPREPVWVRSAGGLAADAAAVLVLIAFGLLTNIFTVLNNAYSQGSTLYDSTIFQTIIWRSGWPLTPAPAVDDISFLNTHFSPINYIPDLISYAVPLDRMTYSGVVYGAVYGGILVLAFVALRGLCTTLPALAGALALYLSGEILNAQWEPHQEIASALLTLGFFLAWSGRRNWLALACLVLNAAVREDCGLLLALPLLILAAHSAWTQRASWRWTALFDLQYPNALGFALMSSMLSVTAFATKARYFTGHDVVAAFYYGDAFNHLTADLLHRRADYYLHHAQYLWLPGVVLLIGAATLRDIRIAIGWIAFLPYWLFSFLSQGELNAEMGAYKAFPLVLSLVWPALLVRIAPEARSRGLVWVQAGVLLAACVSYEDGSIQVGAPFGIAGSVHRWLPQPEIRQAGIYRAFEDRLQHVGDLGHIRASQGVLALYPYQFQRWDFSSLTDQALAQAADLDSLMWFEGDRDASRVDTTLAVARLPHRYRVRGTKMWLATRLPAERLTAFAGAIEAVGAPASPEEQGPDPRASTKASTP